MLRFIAPALVTSLLLGACAARYVESPVYDSEFKVRRSPDVEAITEVMERYARALDTMDLESIQAIVSEDYYENAGTTDTTNDDYGFEELTDVMQALRQHVESVNIGIAVRDIRIDGDLADVLFEYDLRMRYRVGDQARWETKRDVNRFQLRRERGAWLIVSGL